MPSEVATVVVGGGAGEVNARGMEETSRSWERGCGWRLFVNLGRAKGAAAFNGWRAVG